MSDAADFDFDIPSEPSFVTWELDPLEEDGGGMITVQRVSLVRIACVAAEAGARMQREGLSDDPVSWMIAPLELFGGLAPIEACLERLPCSKAILLHGLGLALNANSASLEKLVGNKRSVNHREPVHA
ncbi:hypothetical protein [Qipengyuania flava]|uniref:hypothetical protein n=1 Tax=Qipengyuania flava TaxID=192812 RepID=UPI001CFE2A0C|nr:hypothetical protein [Qipengyuania flava]